MQSGATSLVETAVRAGVEICFANPGTTEMPIVLALDQVRGMRPVLGLFEGVCTGAADGWARMRGRPAATLLHLGPGLANGIANLHNARRARTPVVNWVGDHTTQHLPVDSVLTSDIAALTGSVGWTGTVARAADMASASLEAVRTALGAPGRVASLIIPANCQWEPGPPASTERPAPVVRAVDAALVREAAQRLRASGSVLFLGSTALTERGQRAAARVAAATGCTVWVETFPSRQERGRHLPAFRQLPYFPEEASKALAPATCLVLAGAREPVAMFGYPGMPSRFTLPAVPRVPLADPDAGDDATAALEALVDELGAPEVPNLGVQPPAFTPTGAALDPDALGRTVAACTPEGSIVVNEAATAGLHWAQLHSPGALPHTVLGLTGGGIGQGLPTALGAALACPDRRVIAFEADGSGLYTVQALWSMAREGTDVTVVICSNRRYRILQLELARVTQTPGPAGRGLTDLSNPEIDWTQLARGFGVRATRATTDTELAAAMQRASSESGPSLIEAVLA